MPLDILLNILLLAPFFSALFIAIIALAQPSSPKIIYSILAIFAPLLSAFLALILIYENYFNGIDIHSEIFTWLSVSAFHIPFSLHLDALSSLMLLFVAPVGFLIHVYALGYMKDDSSYPRFFALFNLFMFFMFLLVLGDNPIMMFLGWEGVGLSSYALISFYYEDAKNVAAGNKAFILNRIGDFGFLSALMLLFISIGEYGFSFSTIELHLHEMSAERINLIAALLFVGAMGKSAQFPLYVWLPDAMAGPTPVSALIHAATMVTAGVYMLARFSDLYAMSESVSLFIAYIGAFSALIAALMASREFDIKKILAYSTMSQLGYMFMAEGLGAYSFAIFHVFTHAFFKALLFMGAGAIIMSLHHEQDIRKMGGLRKSLPMLFIMMLIASLSISAIAPLNGFFSKDAIMGHIFASDAYIIYGIALFTSILTAFYMFRMLFFVFYGEEKIKAVAVSKTMIIPIALLAVGVILSGFLNVPSSFGGSESISIWLNLPDIREFLDHTTEFTLIGLNTFFIFVAIFVAYLKYGSATATREDVDKYRYQKIISNKFYIDELYHILFVKPLYKMSKGFDVYINHKIIDSSIHRTIALYYYIASYYRLIYDGSVRLYALFMVFGLSGLFIYLYFALEAM